MAPTTITYEEAKENVGTLPSLAPRPNAVNLRALSLHLEQKLETIPSQQSPEYGYTGMVMPPEIYALRTPTPWTDWPDPGAHPPAAATTVEQNNLRILYDANKAVYDSQQNIRRAVNDALNVAIPNAFRRPIGNQLGTKVFTVRDNPRQILQELRTKYGTSTPNDKANNDRQFNAQWDANEPIEALFDRLEDCYVFSILAKPPYTMEQLIDKAIIAIQRTGLYETALLEWAGFDEANKTWQQLKLHFEEAYEIRLASGQGTAVFHGYVNNAEAEDDDSISTIQESLNTIHLANSANYASLQEHLQAARAETASLRAELAATQQSMANFAQTMRPVIHAPTVPTYVPQYQAPLVAAPPTSSYLRGRRNNRRGGQRGNTGGQYIPAPSTVGNIPPPATIPPVYAPVPGTQQLKQHNAPFSNVVKHFNNWNMCFTCGFDVPAWHNSQTCNVKHTNAAHQEGCNRENAQAYLAAGHKVNRKAMHKTQLPTNPGPNQA